MRGVITVTEEPGFPPEITRQLLSGIDEADGVTTTARHLAGWLERRKVSGARPRPNAVDTAMFAPARKSADWQPYDRVPALLNLADIVVLPSAKEGIARTDLETMACGRVLVGSDIPATGEVIEHGRTGLLFRREQPADLAETILAAARDNGLRRDIGRRARDYVERNHGLADYGMRFERILLDVVGGHRRRQ